MPISYTGDPNISKYLEQLAALQQASLRWYWRLIAIVVALATVISAIFQALNYCIR